MRSVAYHQRPLSGVLLYSTIICCLICHVAMKAPADATEGDWIVTGTEVVRDSTITLRGNLIVKDGGSLTLLRDTLYVQCSFDGEFGIEVNPGPLGGGSLMIDSGSVKIFV